MNSSSFRHVLFRSYFPAAFLIAIILAVLDAAMPLVLGQVRTATVTVYVTVVHTVPVYVPVTAYVTVASVATSFVTLTNTAVSLGTVTLSNTVSFWITVTTAGNGVPKLIPGEGGPGPIPQIVLAAAGGIAVGFASSIAATRMKYRRLRLGRRLAHLDESLVEAAHLAAELEGIGERLKGPLADLLAGRRVDALISGDSTQWGDLIEEYESSMDKLRDKRDEYQTQFQNFDQKANQLYNLLLNALRNVKELSDGVVRNLL